MKPFNLEAAKAGAPYQTRTGCKAELIHDKLQGDKQLIFKLTDFKGQESIRTTYLDGDILRGEDSCFDVVMSPVKKGAWVNIYPDRISCVKYSTKESENKYIDPDRIACVYVEWEE